MLTNGQTYWIVLAYLLAYMSSQDNTPASEN